MKTMRSKMPALLLAVVLLLSQAAVFPAFAADEPPAATGGDDYCSVCGSDAKRGDLLHTIAATCAADGYEIYECVAEKTVEGSEPVQCKGTITVCLPASEVAHTKGDTKCAFQAATCEEEGHQAYWLCEVCGCYLDKNGNKMEEKDVILPAKGHYWETSETVPPTCTEDGCKIVECIRCNASRTEPDEAAHGHTFVEVEAKAATCREAGYEAYFACSVCDAEDPERPKVVIPVLDHNCKLIEHKDPTCTEDGYNLFRCEDAACPYGSEAGIREILPALGHDLISHAAKEATCTEIGYAAYETCTRCDYTTYDSDSETPMLEHVPVTLYKDADCTEDGYAGVVACELCGTILHEGEVIPAKGHTFGEVVEAVEPICETDGNLAYKTCTVCGGNFAADSKDGDPAAVALDSVVLKALGHDYVVWSQQLPTCTEEGYQVSYCSRCDVNHSETLAPAGHSFAFVEEIPADCETAGTKAHNTCTACGKNFAVDADAGDIAIEPVADADLTIEALGHAPVSVEAVIPTYNTAGNTAGTKCERCGDWLTAQFLPELKESVKFHYEITGVNGADAAVNSGYVTLNIYFDVLADAADKAEYGSDVLANIFGIDLALTYDESVFELTNVQVAPGAFAKAEFTPYETANENGKVAIAQDMVNSFKVFRGEDNLFASLIFRVNKDAEAKAYTFALDAVQGITVTHPEQDETIDVSSSESEITVSVRKLGDANGDGVFNSADSLLLSEYIKNPDVEKAYITEYDLDKDGDIDFIDLDLLRKAIVGNDEYLTIVVDPGADSDAEV